MLADITAPVSCVCQDGDVDVCVCGYVSPTVYVCVSNSGCLLMLWCTTALQLTCNCSRLPLYGNHQLLLILLATRLAAGQAGMLTHSLPNLPLPFRL